MPSKNAKLSAVHGLDDFYFLGLFCFLAVDIAIDGEHIGGRLALRAPVLGYDLLGGGVQALHVA